MRSEVLKLHAELKTAHKERFDVAEKLHVARNAKEMLAELSQELQGAQLSVDEVENRKRAAEVALQHAREENSQLEETLQAQQERMRNVNVELDEFRQRRVEEAALDCADDFFYTSKSVLRSACYRFRSGVRSRFRLSKIYSSVHSAYASHLKTTCWSNWRHYIARRYLMHVNTRRRRVETLALCMQQWKVFAALEKLFTQCRRKKWMKSVFRAWKKDAQESAFDSWAVVATNELHQLP
jgi:hypothetical protein